MLLDLHLVFKLLASCHPSVAYSSGNHRGLIVDCAEVVQVLSSPFPQEFQLFLVCIWLDIVFVKNHSILQ
jgi:hypothetical protein